MYIEKYHFKAFDLQRMLIEKCICRVPAFRKHKTHQAVILHYPLNIPFITCCLKIAHSELLLSLYLLRNAILAKIDNILPGESAFLVGIDRVIQNLRKIEALIVAVVL